MNEDLDEAMKMAVRESISFLSKQFGLDRRQIYAYLSAATDYEVSQVVDKTKGIHALLSKMDFMDYLTVNLNAGSATLKIKPVNGAFYVSAPEVCKALGLPYSSDATSINVTAPAGSVKMALNSNKYIVGQNSFYVDISPIATKDGVMLPVSVLGDVLGLSVNWSTEGTKIVGRASKL